MPGWKELSTKRNWKEKGNSGCAWDLPEASAELWAGMSWAFEANGESWKSLSDKYFREDI